jgi:hypothetical protein
MPAADRSTVDARLSGRARSRGLTQKPLRVTRYYYGFNSGNDAPAFGFAKLRHFSRQTGTLHSYDSSPILAEWYAGWRHRLLHGRVRTSYSLGEYASFTLTLPNWSGAGGSPIVGDLIKPLSNNAAGCAFKLVTAGTSGNAASYLVHGIKLHCQVCKTVTEVGAHADLEKHRQWRNVSIPMHGGMWHVRRIGTELCDRLRPSRPRYADH